MKKTKELKALLKKIYKQKRLAEGRQIGRQINELTQAIHLQNKLPLEQRDKEVIAVSIGNLVELRKERRFRDDFPNFSSFYKYIVNPKNGFTLEDIKEL